MKTLLKNTFFLSAILLCLLNIPIAYSQQDNQQYSKPVLVDGQKCNNPTGCLCGTTEIEDDCTCRLTDGVAEPCGVIATDPGTVSMLKPTTVIIVVVVIVVVIVIVIIILRRRKN